MLQTGLKNCETNLTLSSVSIMLHCLAIFPASCGCYTECSNYMLSGAVHEDPLASDSQLDNAAASGGSWSLPEISGRRIIPMASEEELEELQDMVDVLLNSDSNEGQAGQGII